MLMANNSLPSAFCRALGKNFAECWNDSQQKKKVPGKGGDGDGGFAECRHGKALGKDSSSEMIRIISNVCDKLCENFSIFYHSLHIWYHEILTNLMIFQSSFALNQFLHTFVVMFREQDVWNFLWFPGYDLTLDSITWIPFSIHFIPLFESLAVQI